MLADLLVSFMFEYQDICVTAFCTCTLVFIIM